MQMIEMRMRDQNQVDGRQVTKLYSRTPQAFKHEKPSGKIGVDDDVLMAHLQKEAGMSDERQAKFAIGYELGFVRSTLAACNRRATHQAPEGPRAFTKDGIF